MSGKRIFITDKEVAKVLELSPKTISRILGGFVRGGDSRRTKTRAAVKRSLKDAQPEAFGGYRRWNVRKLANVLGITEEELIERIS